MKSKKQKQKEKERKKQRDTANNPNLQIISILPSETMIKETILPAFTFINKNKNDTK